MAKQVETWTFAKSNKHFGNLIDKTLIQALWQRNGNQTIIELKKLLIWNIIIHNSEF